MSTAPSMPLFPDAFIADTQHCSLEERGAYMHLLMVTWRNNGKPLPDDDRRMCRILAVAPAKWAKLRPVLAEFFDVLDGTWRQKRLEKEWIFVQERAAKSRANGSHGGRRKSLDNNDSSNPTGYSKDTQDRTQKEPTQAQDQIKEEEKGDPNGSLKNVAPVIDVLPIVETEQPEPADPVAEQKPRRRRASPDNADVDMVAFEEFWQACPKRQAKPVAISAYAAAIESGASAGQLLIAIRRYAEQVKADGTLGKYIKTPGPWLNAKRYLDEYPDDQPSGAQIRSPPFQSSRREAPSMMQAVMNAAARQQEQVFE